jgi:hypothetical protein
VTQVLSFFLNDVMCYLYVEEGEKRDRGVCGTSFINAPLLIGYFSEGILCGVFDRIGWRDLSVLHRVDIQIARTAPPLDGGHHAAEERKIATMCCLNLQFTVALLKSSSKVILNEIRITGKTNKQSLFIWVQHLVSTDHFKKKLYSNRFLYKMVHAN